MFEIWSPIAIMIISQSTVRLRESFVYRATIALLKRYAVSQLYSLREDCTPTLEWRPLSNQPKTPTMLPQYHYS
jgi:hypothetical protein